MPLHATIQTSSLAGVGSRSSGGKRLRWCVVAGGVVAASGAACALTVEIPDGQFEASLSATSVTTCVLTQATTVSASAAASGGVVVTLSQATSLSAAVAAVSTATSVMDLAAALSGAVVSTSGASATLDQSTTVAGAVAAVSATSATLTLASDVSLSATVAAIASASATLSVSGGGLTLLYDGITAGTSTWAFGNSTANNYAAGLTKFTDASSRTIGQISVKLAKMTGDISGKTYRVRIYADSSNNLGTLVGTSDAVAGSNAWSATTVDFAFSTAPTLTGGIVYHITVDNGTSDGSNYAAAYHANPSAIPGQLSYFTSGGTNVYPSTFPNHDLQVAIYTT